LRTATRQEGPILYGKGYNTGYDVSGAIIRSYIYFWKALRRGTLESFVCWFGRRKAGQNHCSDGFPPLSYCTFLFCPKHCIL